MADHHNIFTSGWSRVVHNKRYIIWFYILNLALALLGAVAFAEQAHEYLDHSLRAERIVNGFDIGVFAEMLMQPNFGTLSASHASGVHFALAFFFLTALFMPGILQGYASTYRLPRDDFFRACGRNLWRFIRLMIVAGIVMGAVAGAFYGLQAALLKAAGESTNELLPFEMRMLSLLVVFLVMTSLRIWFDLAQADLVLSDQNAVRRSIGLGFRHTWRSFGQLLGSYVVTTIAALIIVCAGLWIWTKLPSASVLGAFVVTQLTLLLLLIPRFWQRGVAVSYYLQNMVEPVTPVVMPNPPAEPQPS